MTLLVHSPDAAGSFRVVSRALLTLRSVLVIPVVILFDVMEIDARTTFLQNSSSEVRSFAYVLTPHLMGRFQLCLASCRYIWLTGTVRQQEFGNQHSGHVLQAAEIGAKLSVFSGLAAANPCSLGASDVSVFKGASDCAQGIRCVCWKTHSHCWIVGAEGDDLLFV